MSVEMRVETITPEKAADWLSKNGSNRPLSPGHVSRLAAAIGNDEWRLNGESVKFNGDFLVDGQHRLNAIIRAGKPIKSYVVRGVDKDTYDTIDQGKSRSLSDVLARAGERHYTILASAVRWVRSIKLGTTYGMTSHDTNKFLHQYLLSSPGIRDSSEFICRVEMANFKGAKGLMSALHYMFSRSNREKADEFFVRLFVGENLNRNMPEYKLRVILIDETTSLRKLSKETICILTIKAWNAVVSGKELKQLKTSSDEARPKIL